MSTSALGSVKGKKLGRKRVSVLGPKKPVMEQLQSAFQVPKVDSLVDDQSFDLVEHGGVRCVQIVMAKDASRADDPDRRLPSLHRSHLDRGRVRSEDDLIGDIEGVGWIPRRMSGRDVEGLEIVIGGFDLGAVFYRVAHRDENRLHLGTNERDWMPMPYTRL